MRRIGGLSPWHQDAGGLSRPTSRERELQGLGKAPTLGKSNVRKASVVEEWIPSSRSLPLSARESRFELRGKHWPPSYTSPTGSQLHEGMLHECEAQEEFFKRTAEPPPLTAPAGVAWRLSTSLGCRGTRGKCESQEKVASSSVDHEFKNSFWSLELREALKKQELQQAAEAKAKAKAEAKSTLQKAAAAAHAAVLLGPNASIPLKTEVEVVLQGYEEPENLPAAEVSPQHPLILPNIRHRVPYFDPVRRQDSLPGGGQFAIFDDLDVDIPDARALRKMRFKLRDRGSATERGRSTTEEVEISGLDEAYYLHKLKKDPKNGRMLLGYASYLAKKQRLVEAENTYRQLIAVPVVGRSDEHADSLYAYAMFLWETDRSEDAERYFQMGLKFNDRHFGILRNYGLALFSRGSYIVAREMFHRASTIFPTNAEVKLGYVVCLEHLNMDHTGLEHLSIDDLYKEILSLDPSNVQAMFCYALFCKRQNKRELAKEYYEKTLALTPDDPTVLCSYAVLLSEDAFHDSSLFAKAESVFSKLLVQNPKDKAIIYSFAVTLSIKLRLLLSAEGAMEQELVMCSEAMHEHEHQYMVSKLSGSTPESMHATGGGRPRQTDIRRSTNQRIFTMINTPTGRPKRFTVFRHEKLLKKSFVNKVDMSDGVAHARAFEGQHVQVGGQCDGKSEGQIQQDENILLTDVTGLPLESAQALATSLFEEALKLGGETESHIVGAYAVFLAVVVRTEAALARAQLLFRQAVKLGRSHDAKITAQYYIDALRLHKGPTGERIAHRLATEWGLEHHTTLHPATPLDVSEISSPDGHTRPLSAIRNTGAVRGRGRTSPLIACNLPRSIAVRKPLLLNDTADLPDPSAAALRPFTREGWGAGTTPSTPFNLNLGLGARAHPLP